MNNAKDFTAETIVRIQCQLERTFITARRGHNGYKPKIVFLPHFVTMQT